MLKKQGGISSLIAHSSRPVGSSIELTGMFLYILFI
ncbi:hypothetical protein HU200_022938 [Digitaria exilis]|uniref:Uncharacterized protein n=1 Tax=Digitaria exilis TaxID=1010633 RepID=A0A835C9S5_9POAL|nr:hypothetical protein HU200_022938 [Digitaria exilis]